MRTRAPHIRYSTEELAFLEERKAMSRVALHAAFVEAFGRTDVSQQNLTGLMKRKGWHSGRDGRFPKGNVPVNRGMKMPFNAASAATRFRKGIVPHTYRGPGHERICERTGYVMMIVAEKNPWTGAETRSVLKHRYLWEQQNGPVPEGMVLKCLDGDRSNADPSNWEPVPKGMIPPLSLKRGYDNAPAELKPAIMAVTKLEHAVSKRRNREKEV